MGNCLNPLFVSGVIANVAGSADMPLMESIPAEYDDEYEE